MAENKRVAIFFLIILLLIGGFIGWLTFVQPPAPTETVSKEIPHERYLQQ